MTTEKNILSISNGKIWKDHSTQLFRFWEEKKKKTYL